MRAESSSYAAGKSTAPNGKIGEFNAYARAATPDSNTPTR